MATIQIDGKNLFTICNCTLCGGWSLYRGGLAEVLHVWWNTLWGG